MTQPTPPLKIMRALRQRPYLTIAQLSNITELPRAVVAQAVGALAGRSRIELAPNSSRLWQIKGTAKQENLFERPAYMRLGSGDRRDDCRNYSDCLDEFVKRHRHDDVDGHCPTWCEHYSPVTRDERAWAATVERADGNVCDEGEGNVCDEGEGDCE